MTTLRRLIQKLNENGLALLIARLLVGGVFIYSGLTKIGQPIDFLKLLKQYEMFPQDGYSLMNLVAVVLPWIELLGGLALLVGVVLRGTGGVLFVMMITFTSAIVARTLHIMSTEGTPFFEIEFACGCQGVEPEIIWKKLLENTGLILLSLLVVLSNTRRYCLSVLFCKNS